MTYNNSPAKILIVEDDDTLSEQLSDLLIQNGYQTVRCHDGPSGLTAAISDSFQLILLDVLLPDMDGITLLNRLRKSRQTPVMMLTACGAEEDRITGYSSGADDYLSKPFNPKELLLRIEAILRRTFSRQKLQSSFCLEFKGLMLRKDQCRVYFEGRELVITPVEFRLLWVLVDHRHQVMSKPYLCQLVLERSFNRHDRSLDMHVSKIRRKLNAAGMEDNLIQTVHGQGYRVS